MLALCGVAVAAAVGAREAHAQAISACVNEANGQLRIVSRATECRAQESLVIWKRANLQHSKSSDDCSGLVITPLPIGDPHCPFGGVKLSVRSREDDDDHKGKDDRKGEDDRNTQSTRPDRAVATTTTAVKTRLRPWLSFAMARPALRGRPGPPALQVPRAPQVLRVAAETHSRPEWWVRF